MWWWAEIITLKCPGVIQTQFNRSSHRGNTPSDGATHVEMSRRRSSNIGVNSVRFNSGVAASDARMNAWKPTVLISYLLLSSTWRVG